MTPLTLGTLSTEPFPVADGDARAAKKDEAAIGHLVKLYALACPGLPDERTAAVQDELWALATLLGVNGGKLVRELQREFER